MNTEAEKIWLVKRLRKAAEHAGMLTSDPPQPSPMMALLNEAADAIAGALKPVAGNSVIVEIADERRRQVEAEGWTQEHDDTHDKGEMARAASCYALGKDRVTWTERMPSQIHPVTKFRITWPWAPEWWKPKGRRRNLIRAAALIVAEIERLDRAAQANGAAP